MLVLAHKENTTILIGDDIAVTPRRIRATDVLLEVEYPAGMTLAGPAGPIAPQTPGGAPPGDRCVGRAQLKTDDDLLIGEDITVKIVAIRASVARVRLGFGAPREILILRKERAADGAKAGKIP